MSQAQGALRNVKIVGGVLKLSCNEEGVLQTHTWIGVCELVLVIIDYGVKQQVTCTHKSRTSSHVACELVSTCNNRLWNQAISYNVCTHKSRTSSHIAMQAFYTGLTE